MNQDKKKRKEEREESDSILKTEVSINRVGYIHCLLETTDWHFLQKVTHTEFLTCKFYWDFMLNIRKYTDFYKYAHLSIFITYTFGPVPNLV